VCELLSMCVSVCMFATIRMTVLCNFMCVIDVYLNFRIGRTINEVKAYNRGKVWPQAPHVIQIPESDLFEFDATINRETDNTKLDFTVSNEDNDGKQSCIYTYKDKKGVLDNRYLAFDKVYTVITVRVSVKGNRTGWKEQREFVVEFTSVLSHCNVLTICCKKHTCVESLQCPYHLLQETHVY